jgi:hypothetical protein
MTQDAFQMKWEGVKRTIAKEIFAAASRRRQERSKKCL